jgi:fatty acid desaturase
VGLVLLWLRYVCAMSMTEYVLCFVYPGCALSLVRSFAEHRADPDPRRRVAVVENAPVLGLLFLNNNLHAAHHDRPDLPWHRLPQFYARERQRLVTANGGLVYAGYADVFRRYLWRAQDDGVRPQAWSVEG